MSVDLGRVLTVRHNVRSHTTGRTRNSSIVAEEVGSHALVGEFARELNSSGGAVANIFDQDANSSSNVRVPLQTHLGRTEVSPYFGFANLTRDAEGSVNKLYTDGGDNKSNGIDPTHNHGPEGHIPLVY